MSPNFFAKIDKVFILTKLLWLIKTIFIFSLFGEHSESEV